MLFLKKDGVMEDKEGVTVWFGWGKRRQERNCRTSKECMEGRVEKKGNG